MLHTSFDSLLTIATMILSFIHIWRYPTIEEFSWIDFVALHKINTHTHHEYA